jgi:hypothetical protein
VFQNLLNQNRDVSVKSKSFESKPKRFDVFQNFKNKIGTFPFNLKTSEQNQNVLMCSRIFKNKS